MQLTVFSNMLHKLRCVEQKLTKEFEKITGFSITRYEMLAFLKDNGDSLQRDIAGYLDIDPSAVTRHIKILEKNGYITRERNEDNGRDVIVSLTEFAKDGLKMIEIDRDSLSDLNQLISILSQSHHPFIIFCDDLSFEAEDSSYKSLKALLDGSLMNPPENILFYATSNSRHLLPDYMSDNQNARMDHNNESHLGEAIEEKISLSERFGIWLTFYSFSQNDYLNIVRNWLAILDSTIEFTDDTEKDALQFALLRGSRSGRVAIQFAKNHVGQHQLQHLNKE